MTSAINHVLSGQELTSEDLVYLLSALSDEEEAVLLKKAYAVKVATVGQPVHIRALIEISNVCQKNCLYCGIRKDNQVLLRYDLPDDSILRAVETAFQDGIRGVVLQAGECRSRPFTQRITNLIGQIKHATEAGFRITLSLGEQAPDTYKTWFEAGATRYLLRIETSHESLYRRLHPQDGRHRFQDRLTCLESLQSIGYMTGTGVMIGLPTQTVENLVADLLFMKALDVDMIGMGPYVPCPATPLYAVRQQLWSPYDRFRLSLRMIALARLLMPSINIASTTALHALEEEGQEAGIQAGANVWMPVYTPSPYRAHYALYDRPFSQTTEKKGVLSDVIKRLGRHGETIAYNDYGNSRRYLDKQRIKHQTG